MNTLFLLLRIAWASPWTLVGVGFGLLGLMTGGKYQRTGKVLEFYGGLVERILSRLPVIGAAAAMTLGHVVLARTQVDLDRTRRHEAVHVAQYERWGLLFIPAYLGCSAWLWWRGRNPYLDNPFEREAYDTAG